MYKKVAGFSLIELLIVVAIIGVVSAIAYPAYTNSAYKSRRADAITTLLDLQLQQEKHRSVNSQYTTSLSNLGYSSSTSPDGYYTISIVSADQNGYEMKALIKTGTAQVGDSCDKFVISQNGPDYTGTNASRTCWNK